MIERFGLYLVLTDPRAGYERCTRAAVDQGVRYVQLRMKHASRPAIETVARRMRDIARGSETLFIVNDDVGLASEVDADGVHLGQQDMALTVARERWPLAEKRFGLSTHDETQELAARALQPDYVGVGPVFATPTKEVPDPVLGPDHAAAICRSSPLTTVAIGGIDPSNLLALLRNGVVNFAVVRAVCSSQEPESAIAALMSIWREHSG